MCIRDRGWAAYQYGMASGIPNVALSFTRDQGETWERRCELSYYPTGIFFLDESVGIMVGSLDLRERYLDRSRFYVFSNIQRTAARHGRIISQSWTLRAAATTSGSAIFAKPFFPSENFLNMRIC